MSLTSAGRAYGGADGSPERNEVRKYIYTSFFFSFLFFFFPCEFSFGVFVLGELFLISVLYWIVIALLRLALLLHC